MASENATRKKPLPVVLRRDLVKSFRYAIFKHLPKAALLLTQYGANPTAVIIDTNDEFDGKTAIEVLQARGDYVLADALLEKYDEFQKTSGYLGRTCLMLPLPQTQPHAQPQPQPQPLPSTTKPLPAAPTSEPADSKSKGHYSYSPPNPPNPADPNEKIGKNVVVEEKTTRCSFFSLFRPKQKPRNDDRQHQPIEPERFQVMSSAVVESIPMADQVHHEHNTSLQTLHVSDTDVTTIATETEVMSTSDTLVLPGDFSHYTPSLSRRINVRLAQLKSAIEIRDELGVYELLLFPDIKRSIIMTEGEDHEFPLFWAAKSGSLSIIEDVLKAGARITQRTGKGWSALHAAAFYDQPGVIDAVGDLDVNVITKRLETPLHLAAMQGNVAVVHELLARNANTAMMTVDGETALTLAEKGNHEKVVRLLVYSPSIASIPSYSPSLSLQRKTKRSGSLNPGPSSLIEEFEEMERTPSSEIML